MENEEYNPVEPNYYNYKAKDFLTSEISNDIINYSNIYACCYDVNNNGKFPFMRFLLTNSIMNKTLYFPQIPVFKNFDSNELINFSKIGIFGLLMLDEFDYFNANIKFDGFYEYDDKLYLFFDITNCKAEINDIYSNNNLWFTLIDEILNQKRICDIPIDSKVTEFFTLNELFCFLEDKNNNSYEIPIVGYVRKPENKLNFTYIFGEIKSDKNSILGPYYYFTDYDKIFKNKYEDKSGIVRFALFTGVTKYIENHENDLIDDSEIKKERLKDNNLNQNLENLTMRISDHDGKWAESYDSACIKNIELDNGQLFDETIITIKEYEQQIPLSYHFINKTSEEIQSIV